MNEFDHNKYIKKAVKENLKEFNIKQIGSSRTYIVDFGYGFITIEFQPSSWQKGTFLNMSLTLPWYPKDYISFDFPIVDDSTRVLSFISIESEKKFKIEFDEFLSIIKQNLTMLNKNGLNNLLNKLMHKEYITASWENYYKAVYLRLIDRTDESKIIFNVILNEKNNISWILERNKVIEELLEIIDSKEVFEEKILKYINHTRSKINLPEKNIVIFKEIKTR